MVQRSPKSAPSATAISRPVSGVDAYFGITARGSTVAREVRGGLVTFFTMAYILALNPLIIGTAPDGAGNLLGGLPYLDGGGQVLGANVDATITLVAGATALVAGLMTILMGVVGRFPIGIAAGLGINALLAFTIAPLMTWPQAMGLIVVEGVLIALLVLTGFRTAVFRAVPRSLRSGISIGIGLFIVFVGLVDGGIVRKPEGSVPVELGVGGSILGWPMLVFVLGLFAVAVLYARRVRGALLISIIGATVVAVLIELVAKAGPKTADNPTGWALNVPSLNGIVSVPDLSLIGDVDVLGAFGPSFAGGFQAHLFIPLALLVFSLLLADFFDTMGTVVAVGAEGDLLDEHGTPPHLGAVLMVDSVAAAAGGLGSVSSNTSYVESVAGVGEGARTGLASVVTGIGFLLAMFFAPLVNIVPSEAVTPALVFVGFLMMSQITKIDFDDVEEGLPAFLTLALMPFTFSITIGIGAGFISYVVLKVARGKARQLHPLMWVVAGAFVVYFASGVLNQLVR
ncbi:putative MFS transporter, AGZA family, xanthine/uracil permease [Friedmanniella luteola]|uniref:Putative MFS transporter, AGZA family, xanthine/uracil permease n=1 Tax=Friedmanniella luteola TaxID=546871 RepID=A0A1H1MDE1_9ACTN|nr:NCS2 family permease [Friedmanniella luteola]SDR84813.1 putative MFS transporter, AGZA family, xanthine/uracil permease [Friedmanniella luteola]